MRRISLCDSSGPRTLEVVVEEFDVLNDAGVAGVLGAFGTDEEWFGAFDHRRRGLPRPPSKNEAMEDFLESGLALLRRDCLLSGLVVLLRLFCDADRTSDLMAVTPGRQPSGVVGLQGGEGSSVTGTSVEIALLFVFAPLGN